MYLKVPTETLVEEEDRDQIHEDTLNHIVSFIRILLANIMFLIIAVWYINHCTQSKQNNVTPYQISTTTTSPDFISEWSDSCKYTRKKPLAILRSLEYSGVSFSENSIRWIWNKDAEDFRPNLLEHFRKSCFVEYGDAWFLADKALRLPEPPGFFVFVSGHFEPEDFTWVEVIHFARSKDNKKSYDDPSIGQFWYYSAPGSGIWINIGKAWRYSSLHGKHFGHQMSDGCAKVIPMGYDTIILWPDNHGLQKNQSRYGGVVEIVDCTAAKKIPENLKIMWEGPCPHEDSLELRTGGNHEYSCECDHNISVLNCNKGNSSLDGTVKTSQKSTIQHSGSYLQNELQRDHFYSYLKHFYPNTSVDTFQNKWGIKSWADLMFLYIEMVPEPERSEFQDKSTKYPSTIHGWFRTIAHNRRFTEKPFFRKYIYPSTRKRKNEHVYRDWKFGKGIPNDTKIEIFHWKEIAFYGFWMYVHDGTGLWYDVGNTTVFNTHKEWCAHFLCHQTKYEVPGFTCEDAYKCETPVSRSLTRLVMEVSRKYGYDSIQFIEHYEPRPGTYTFEILDIRGVLIKKVKQKICPLVLDSFYIRHGDGYRQCKWCQPRANFFNCNGIPVIRESWNYSDFSSGK